MKTREKGYTDYGFEKDEGKRLKEYCKKAEFEDHKILIDSAMEANQCIAPELYFSIVSGISYDDLTRIKYIPLPKVDFYGYQRRCLAIFRKTLIGLGKWR